MGDKWETLLRPNVDPPRDLIHQILNLLDNDVKSDENY